MVVFLCGINSAALHRTLVLPGSKSPSLNNHPLWGRDFISPVTLSIHVVWGKTVLNEGPGHVGPSKVERKHQGIDFPSWRDTSAIPWSQAWGRSTYELVTRSLPLEPDQSQNRGMFKGPDGRNLQNAMQYRKSSSGSQNLPLKDCSLHI